MKAVACEKAKSGIQGPTSKITKHKKDIENDQIQSNLSRLKDLVPFMPKNRRVSKLEIIHYVIEYICDLQYALETHPRIDSAAVQSAAAVMLCSSSTQQSNTNLPIVTPLHRQPLGVLPPNANVVVNSTTSPDSSPVSSARQCEKVSSTTDSKTLSC